MERSQEKRHIDFDIMKCCGQQCQKENMAAAVTDFVPWLTDKLRSLKTDEGVFGSYISGILESEDSIDDKKDALEGILSEILVSPCNLTLPRLMF